MTARPSARTFAAATLVPAETDLFGYRAGADQYPHSPGHKVGGTSREAAVKITPHAKTVRAQVLREYVLALPKALAPDHVAARLGESVLTVRPRVSELARMGLLVPVEERAKNESGHAARMLRATTAGRQAIEASQ